jgi:hypothetical protein
MNTATVSPNMLLTTRFICLVCAMAQIAGLAEGALMRSRAMSGGRS